jgi:3-deoxy-D-manno-octulosonic-acid transferase
VFSLLYNLSLFVYALVASPKLLWQRFALGKYRHSLSARLGIALPAFTPQKDQDVIWIHAVSMGETRAIIPLFHKLKQTHPNAAILISTTTETGQAEAKRAMPEASAHFILPLDFSWAVRRVMKRVRPTLLILCESDFWYHLFKIAKQQGAKLALVNGKISERSHRRFQKVPFFTTRLFAHLDLACVQSERYFQRFLSLGIPAQKLFVSGNLKLDTPAKKMDATEREALKQKLHIAQEDLVLVLGSTHAPEEEWILSSLIPVWNHIPSLKVLLIPRHPERFPEVAHLIQEKGLPFSRYSALSSQPLILIDAMGLLPQCYQIADVAIVGGSYATHVGGHNIFEPVSHGVPTLFGPHMHSQLDLKELILTNRAGKEVSKEELSSVLIELLSTPTLRHQYSSASNALTASVQGSSERTLEQILKMKNPKKVVAV